MYENKLVNV